MSPRPVFTTHEILDEVAERFGLTDVQARMLAAKTGLAKHVALRKQRDEFVLKGGTLLHHVYGSPRVSVVDIDYADGREDKASDVESIKAALTGDDVDLGFSIDVERGIWTETGGLVSGEEIPFVIRRLGGGEDEIINISVAVRRGEVLDGIDTVEFQPVGLLDDQGFDAYALTLSEAAAEKIIGWCIKGKPKHFHDLAFIARSDPSIDTTHVAGLVAAKFEAERDAAETSDEYVRRKLERPGDLRRYWMPEARINSLRKKWRNRMGEEIILDLAEVERENDSLSDFDVVLRLVSDCFDGVFDRL